MKLYVEFHLSCLLRFYRTVQIKVTRYMFQFQRIFLGHDLLLNFFTLHKQVPRNKRQKDGDFDVAQATLRG